MQNEKRPTGIHTKQAAHVNSPGCEDFLATQLHLNIQTIVQGILCLSKEREEQSRDQHLSVVPLKILPILFRSGEVFPLLLFYTAS